jgi:hypothetical protein
MLDWEPRLRLVQLEVCAEYTRCISGHSSDHYTMRVCSIMTYACARKLNSL